MKKSLIAFIYIQTSVLLKLYRYLISIFKYNLPVEYTENVKIEIENQVRSGIKTRIYIT